MEKAKTTCETKTDVNCLENEKRLCTNAYYLELEGNPNFGTIFKISCTWILLFVNLVPISLIISLELVKYF